MIKLLTFLIIFFTGIQLQILPVQKIFGIGLEAIRQVFFIYFALTVLICLFLLNKSSINRNTINTFLFLFFGFIIIGLLYTPSYFYGFVDIVKIAYVIFSFLIFDMFFHIYGYEKSIKYIDRFICFAFFIFISQVISNIVGGRYLSPDTDEFLMSGKTGRAIGSMFCSILAIYFYIQYLDLKKIHYILLFILSSSGVMLSFSRISIAGFLITFFMVNLFYRKLKYLLVISLIGIAIYSPFINILIKESFVGNIETLQNIKGIDFLTLLSLIRLTGRKILWAEAYKGFLSSPIWGNGTGYANYSIKLITEGFNEQVHNDYLKILSDLGLIGLFLYLGIYLHMFKNAKKNYNYDKQNLKKPYFMFIATLIQVLVFSFTDNVISYGPYLLIYLFLFYLHLIYAKYNLNKVDNYENRTYN